MLHYFAPANGRPTACQRSNVRVLETVEYECSGARVLASKSSSVRPSTREYESRDSTLAFKFRVSRTVVTIDHKHINFYILYTVLIVQSITTDCYMVLQSTDCTWYMYYKVSTVL